MYVYLQKHSFNNNQFSKYCESFDQSSQAYLTSKQTKSTTNKKWRLSKQIKTWINRSQQRKVLASLDDRMLLDIGLKPAQARIESQKPFWR